MLTLVLEMIGYSKAGIASPLPPHTPLTHLLYVVPGVELQGGPPLTCSTTVLYALALNVRTNCMLYVLARDSTQTVLSIV